MNYDTLTQKKKQLNGLMAPSAALLRNLNDWFRVELTYSSNAIEGNTLTRQETAVVVEQGLTVGGKSLREHLEATNHIRALDFVWELIRKQPTALTERNILDIHSAIMTGLDNEIAGRYRSVPVRIAGSAVVLPNPNKVSSLMAEFQSWLTNKPDLHPVAFASEAHYRLVTIHPFADGNGRTGRLLMNALLMLNGYPPAIIRPEDRLAYIRALEQAQLGGSKESYEKMIYDAADRSLDIYLEASMNQTSLAEPSDDDEDSWLWFGSDHVVASALPAQLAGNHTETSAKVDTSKAIALYEARAKFMAQANESGSEAGLIVASELPAQLPAEPNKTLDIDKLMKIGELAKLVGETVPTIRFWTKEGLLKVTAVTKSGYQLYDETMAQRCEEIQRLKGERFTLNEIKGKL